jgi:two-component system, OmpR family, sensor histidine kinase KdpD
MFDLRPDPDVLLARVQAEEVNQVQEKLKISFGAVPGVGKTHSMLKAARRVGKEGVTIAIGHRLASP